MFHILIASIIITFTWVPNPESNITGYKLYRNGVPKWQGTTYRATIETETGCFAVTALNAKKKESPISNIMCLPPVNDEISMDSDGDGDVDGKDLTAIAKHGIEALGFFAKEFGN